MRLYASTPPRSTPTTPFTTTRLTLVLTAVLLLVGGLLLAHPDRAGAAADPLISQGRPATSSSVEDGTFGPEKAFDGVSTTRWASAEGSDPQWIRVDLGAGSTVSRVKLVWEAAYAKAYRVEISEDGTTWTRLATETAGNGGTDDWTGLTGKGRHLRVYGTARGTSYGYSLFAVEVYGTTGTPPPPTGAFTVVAAGDIAAQCTASSSSCAHPKTAALAQRIAPSFYLTMGDNQYDDALLSDFRAYYDKSWGAFKAKTRPVPGNHETYDPAGSLAGYKAYFGAIAYPQGKPYYSYDQGNWHFVALDSNSFDDPAQIQWLKDDLARNTKGCLAAYFHHPCTPPAATATTPSPGRSGRSCTGPRPTSCSTDTTTTTSGSPRRTRTGAPPPTASSRSSGAWAAPTPTTSRRSSRTARSGSAARTAS
ncbi:discoidin domain-containing protein [Streptomyces sp. SBC-4]|nr:discoidin domain-containing protein [Streptomyces sp. SBC-4]MDV5144881.1 discoidin domain-containing protein [Streptomyces sp. SBC-4]